MVPFFSYRKEKAEFQQNMAEELAKWEEFKCEEGRKLQREKKLFEKHAAAARARPNKQERNEIQVSMSTIAFIPDLFLLLLCTAQINVQ